MKLFRIALFATLLSVGIASCGGSNDDPINNVTPTPTPSNTTVKVESVAVSSATISLKEGESQTITVTITPTNATDKKYTFSSSDKDVATVDDTGKITALKAGEATITVTTSDGNKTATCKVTVTSNAPVLNKKMVRWYRYKDGSQDKKGGFSYDSEGKIVRDERFYSNREGTGVYTFKYEEDRIVINYSDEGGGQQFLYYISENRITSAPLGDASDANYQHSYSNDYLDKSISDYSYFNYHWTDGNMVKIERGDIENGIDNIHAIEYSNDLWPDGFIWIYLPCPNGTIDLWHDLIPAGYWGKHNKNLPSSFKNLNKDGSVYEEYRFKWTIEDGYPVKVEQSYYENNILKRQLTFTYDWE